MENKKRDNLYEIVEFTLKYHRTIIGLLLNMNRTQLPEVKGYPRSKERSIILG